MKTKSIFLYFFLLIYIFVSTVVCIFLYLPLIFMIMYSTSFFFSFEFYFDVAFVTCYFSRLSDERNARHYLQALISKLADELDSVKSVGGLGVPMPVDSSSWRNRKSQKLNKMELLNLQSSLKSEMQAKEVIHQVSHFVETESLVFLCFCFQSIGVNNHFRSTGHDEITDRSRQRHKASLFHSFFRKLLQIFQLSINYDIFIHSWIKFWTKFWMNFWIKFWMNFE